jgi:hypothetical protein
VYGSCACQLVRARGVGPPPERAIVRVCGGAANRDERGPGHAFGGAFYACAYAQEVSVGLEAANLADSISLGRELKNSINDAHEISHPLEPRLKDIYGTIFLAEKERGGPRQRYTPV